MMFTHKQCLILVDHHLPTICEKTGKDVVIFFVSTYQCSILFNNLSSFSRKSEFLRPENLNKPFTKGETINIADLSLLKEFLEKQPCSSYLDVRGGQFADRHMAVAGSCLKTMTWWDAIQPEAMTCQPMQKIDSTGYVRLLWESIGKAT